MAGAGLRVEPGFKQKTRGGGNPLLLAEKIIVILLTDGSGLVADGHQPLVGVIDAQVQPELSPRGEHAVRFVNALVHQIVDQDSRVALRAADYQRFAALDAQRGVDARHNALASGFFVAGGTVDLPGQKQVLDLLRFEPRPQFRGLDHVIFDGVAGPDHLGIFEAGNRFHHGSLHVDGHGSRHAVHVDLVGVETLGLQEKLVVRLVRELHDLVFNRRAVARADTLNLPGIERRAVNVLANHAVRFVVGQGNPADGLFLRNGVRAEAEGRGHGIAGLHFELRKVNGAAVEARRRSGLQAAHFKAHAAQRFAQHHGRWFTRASGGILLLAAVDEAVEKGSGGDHHGSGFDGAAVAQQDAVHSLPWRAAIGCGRRGAIQILQHKVDYFRLLDAKVWFLLQHLAHTDAVELLVGLRAWRPDGWAAAGVKQPELNAHGVDHFAHHAAQGVHFAYQVPLGNSAHGRIARHLADQVEVDGAERGLQPHAGSGHRGFSARVSCAHNHHIVLFSEGRSHGPKIPKDTNQYSSRMSWANHHRLGEGKRSAGNVKITRCSGMVQLFKNRL